MNGEFQVLSDETLLADMTLSWRMLFLKHENYLEIFEGLHWNSQKGKTFSLFPQEIGQGV